LVLLTVDDTIISLSRQRREGGRFTGGHLTVEPAWNWRRVRNSGWDERGSVMPPT
jgi:hypothetical protein